MNCITEGTAVLDRWNAKKISKKMSLPASR